MIKKMIRPAILSLGLIGAAMAVTPAFADYSPREHWRTDQRYQYGYTQNGAYAPAPVLPERAVHRSLRHQGFHNIDSLHLGPRGFYVARATDRYGNRVRVTVDPRSGSIVDVNRRW